MPVMLQELIKKIHNMYYPVMSQSDTVDLFPGLDTRSCNCARFAGIDNFVKGKLLMTQAPHEILHIRNAGQSTMKAMTEYFVNDKKSEWIPNSLRTHTIDYSLTGFLASKITEDEWQYLTNKWFKSNKVKYRFTSKIYIEQLRCIYAGESLTSVAKRTDRCSSTLGHQMRKAVYILNKYITNLPTYKTTQLLES